MAKDGLSKVFDQAFEMDNSWLDRLDMGFDFSDILDDGTDGLVPSLSPTAAQAAAAAFAVPSLDDFELPTTNQLLQDRMIGDDMHGVPMGGSPTFASAMAPHAMEFAPPQLQTLQQQVPMHQVPVPVATLPVAPPEGLTSILSPPATKPPPPPRAPAPASSSSYASTSSRLTTRSAAAAAAAGANGNAGRTALSIPNSEHLTREQRVQRWREKRKNRQFKKTIRYASRKAYAEVRPRIKGRFAKREEVDAWRAAEAAMAAGMPGMAHALGDDLAVPVM